MAKNYGIISDLHHIDPSIMNPLVDILKQEEVDDLILNGDIIGDGTPYKSQDYLATLLTIIGESGFETYVLPGSHEKVHLFEPIVDHFAKKYEHTINAGDHQKIEYANHHLVFLPGSDFHAGKASIHGYSLEEEHETGIYRNQGKLIRVFNMNDLRKLVTEPDKTILFSHIPRRFNNVDTCVDVAEFGEVQINFFADIINYNNGEQQIRIFYQNGENGTILKPKSIKSYVRNQIFEKGSIFPLKIAQLFKNSGAPVEIKRENRGNETLAQLYDQLGITKNITGHFHESAGRAHDSAGNPVEENTFVSNLFYNASCLDRLMVGILSVADNNQVAYENINLKEYFNIP